MFGFRVRSRGACVIMNCRIRKLDFLYSLVCLASMSVGAGQTYALPMDGLTAPWSLSCDDQSVCSGMERSSSAVGKYTGITITKSAAGEAAVEIDKNNAGRFYFEQNGPSLVSLNFSWDGDPHPQQLSGSGLNCLDLTRQGAYAVILSGVRIKGSCSDGAINAVCPEVSIESRVYDARDPTGQRFSSSTIHRTLHQKANVTVPFSNFITGGPRGRADFSCVGAVTLAIRFDGFSSAEMDFGPIFTNGSEGLTPLPTTTPIPTDTPRPATPTSTPHATASTIATEKAVPLAERSVEAPLEAAATTSAPDAALVPTPVAAQEIVAAPTVRPVIPQKKHLSEEVIYGEVVSGAD